MLELVVQVRVFAGCLQAVCESKSCLEKLQARATGGGAPGGPRMAVFTSESSHVSFYDLR